MRRPSAQESIQNLEHDENEDERLYKNKRGMQHGQRTQDYYVLDKSSSGHGSDLDDIYSNRESDFTDRRSASSAVPYRGGNFSSDEDRFERDSAEDHSNKRRSHSKDRDSSIEVGESSFLRHCPDRRTKESEYGSRFADIQPISSITTTQQTYKKIGESEFPSDPLTELRNIARLEADSMRHFPERTEETYFSPPVSPVRIRNPLQYLKKAVTKEEKGERIRRPEVFPDAKPKLKRPYKESSIDSEATVDEEPKATTEYEDAKFNYNQEKKLFYCPWENCGKFFPSLSRIKRHYIIHTKEKPFKCLNKDCMRRFSRKDNMLQHYRVHCPFASNRNP